MAHETVRFEKRARQAAARPKAGRQTV